MRDKHGDMLVDGTIADAAREAVHERGPLCRHPGRATGACEARRACAPAVAAGSARRRPEACRGRLGARPADPEPQAIRRRRQRADRSKVVRNLKPSQYLVAARRASARRLEGRCRGKLHDRHRRQARELFNIELYRLSRRRRSTRSTATVDYMQKFGEARTRQDREGRAGLPRSDRRVPRSLRVRARAAQDARSAQGARAVGRRERNARASP
jgi:hypothetical protein